MIEAGIFGRPIISPASFGVTDRVHQPGEGFEGRLRQADDGNNNYPLPPAVFSSAALRLRSTPIPWPVAVSHAKAKPARRGVPAIDVGRGDYPGTHRGGA